MPCASDIAPEQSMKALLLILCRRCAELAEGSLDAREIRVSFLLPLARSQAKSEPFGCVPLRDSKAEILLTVDIEPCQRQVRIGPRRKKQRCCREFFLQLVRWCGCGEKILVGLGQCEAALNGSICRRQQERALE